VEDRPTQRAPKLLAPIAGFGDAVLVVDEVVGVERGIEKIVVSIAVEVVTTAFRNGIDDASARLAEFGFVARAGYLKFLDDVFAELKGIAGAADLLLEEGMLLLPPSTM
jgi:hypothetical protein